MRILRSAHSCDVDSTIQPYIRAMLKDYDAIILSPYMGVEQYAEFGKKVIIDACHPLGHLELLDGRLLWQKMADDAEKAGLSVIVHRETGEEPQP